MLKALVVTTLILGGASVDEAPLPDEATFTFKASGVMPRSARVRSGGRVTFVNGDYQPHQVTSNPHPSHTDCPELNGPVLQAGESFSTTVATTPAACGFHDHLDPTNARLRGTLQVG